MGIIVEIPSHCLSRTLFNPKIFHGQMVFVHFESSMLPYSEKSGDKFIKINSFSVGSE